MPGMGVWNRLSSKRADTAITQYEVRSTEEKKATTLRGWMLLGLAVDSKRYVE